MKAFGFTDATTPQMRRGPLQSPAFACPICHEVWPRPSTTVCQTTTDYQFGTDGRAPRVSFSEVQCQGCAGVYKEPRFTDRGMAVLFAQAARSYGSEHPAARAQEQVAWLEARGLTGNLLDFGCGDGTFLGAVPATRKRRGYDIDPGMIATAAIAHPGIEFSVERPMGTWYPSVATFWHALEHLPEPHHDLDIPAQHLVVEVPIAEGHHYADICGFLTVQHQTHFTRASLTRLLARCGWMIRDMELMPYNGLRVWATRDRAAARQIILEDDPTWPETYRARHAVAVAAVDARLRSVRGQPFILWGAGMHTEQLYHETRLREHMPTALVDSDPGKVGQDWRGVQIHPVEFARSIAQWGRLVISSYGSQREIYAQALALGWRADQIVTLYENPVVY
jgi:hypothetical protein